MIPTRRRLEYASGYLDLGMIKDAADELDMIEGKDAQSADVMRLRVALYHQSKQWDQLTHVAEVLATLVPNEEQGWISWAYALRELERVDQAQSVLLRAEPLHGETSAVLHYNLACYACLLGDKEEALKRLSLACELEDDFLSSALDDPDLESMQDEIADIF